MAYNRENLLRRIIDIQNIVLEHKERFVPQKTIYEKYIKEQFHISYSSFNTYLDVPAKAQLKELLAGDEHQQEINKRQLELFNIEEQ